MDIERETLTTIASIGRQLDAIIKLLAATKNGALVVDVWKDGTDTKRHYAVIGDDLWQVKRGDVNEAAGFTRITLHEDEFQRWIEARGLRLRINPMSGKYKYEN